MFWVIIRVVLSVMCLGLGVAVISAVLDNNRMIKIGLGMVWFGILATAMSVIWGVPLP